MASGLGQQTDAIRRRIGLPGNGLSQVERLERAERLLAARIAHAHWAGRHLASWAVTTSRKQRVDCRERDLVELLTTPNSLWMAQRWNAYQVHLRLRPLAQATLENQLRLLRWL